MGSEHWASSRKAGAAPQCCSQQLLGEQAGRMDNCLVLKGKLDLHGHGALNQSSSKRLSFLLFTLITCLGLPGAEGGTHLDAPWFHWKGGQVRFFFEDMTNADRRVIRASMKSIERRTCLRFIEEKGPIAGHHLKVQGAKTTCLAGPGKVPTFSATVGAIPPNKTEVVLQSYYQLADSPRCVNESRGGLLHELFHVFGVMHTQKRPDRDRHVRVLKENIQDQFEFSYDICYECKDYGIPYDCDSIMNFVTETFSLGKPTMESVDPNCDLRWVGAAFDGRHGKSIASPSDWKLLNIIGDKLCNDNARPTKPRTTRKPKITQRPKTTRRPRTTRRPTPTRRPRTTTTRRPRTTTTRRPRTTRPTKGSRRRPKGPRGSNVRRPRKQPPPGLIWD